MIATAATAVGLPLPLTVRAVEAPSAGGAPIDQLMIVSVFTMAAYAVLAWVMLRERKGHATLVGRAADLVARVEGGPRWFALPTLIALGGALSGAVGVYWDVSYHITEGRDEGPLANPSHYLIFLGLLAIFFGGALGMALARDQLPRRTVRITRTWRTPVGPTVITGIALCALAGFPMDDVWHRLFGQDVTEWGPTHVLMIGGTIMLPYGVLLAVAEARQVSRARLAPVLAFIAHSYLIIGPVAFLLEYAFGVPQFPLIMDVLVMTIGAVAGLVWASQHGALYTLGVWVFYVALQGALLVVNDVAWGALSPRFPLLAGGVLAAVVLARFARPTAAYGAVAGAVVGLAVVPLEVFWTNAFRPVEWPTAMLPWAALFAGVIGACVGVVVTWMHTKVLAAATPDVPQQTEPVRSGGWLVRRPAPATTSFGAVAGVAALLAIVIFGWNTQPRSDLTGTADLSVGAVENGRAFIDVRVDPALVEDAYWFHVLSWQGGDLVRSDLDEVSPGVYRTTEPIPVSGNAKSLIRLHAPLHTLVSAPIYLPADPAIPAPEYAAVDGPRPFVKEQQILQRELKTDVPGWLWGAGYASVGLVFVALFGVVALGYTVAGRAGTGVETLQLSRRRRETTGAR